MKLHLHISDIKKAFYERYEDQLDFSWCHEVEEFNDSETQERWVHYQSAYEDGFNAYAERVAKKLAKMKEE